MTRYNTGTWKPTPPSEKPERPYLRVEYRLESNREASWGVFVVVSFDENVLATFTSKVEATAWMRGYETGCEVNY